MSLPFESKQLLHRLDAAYSGHHYDVYRVHPAAQITRKGSLTTEEAPYVVVNSLNPRYYVSAHRSAPEAIRAAQAIHDQHYREYLEVLAEEVNARGYTDEDVAEVIRIIKYNKRVAARQRISRGERKQVNLLVAKHDGMSEALALHAQRASDLWDAADRVERLVYGIFHYIHLATGDNTE